MPTVPVPKSRCEPAAVKLSAPSAGTCSELPSLKFPLAKVPPASVSRGDVVDLIVRAQKQGGAGIHRDSAREAECAARAAREA